MLGNIEAFKAEDDGAVGVLDLGSGAAERDRLVGGLASRREAPRNFHFLFPVCS
jgi:hypothetical protein